MPLTLADVVGLLERRYPPATAEDWDAVGLVAGDPGAPVGKVMLAVDPTEDVAEEALAWGADLLLTHHPLYLRGTSTVAATTPKGRVVHRLLAGGCALYTAHTNADAAADGVAQALADAARAAATPGRSSPSPAAPSTRSWCSCRARTPSGCSTPSPRPAPGAWATTSAPPSPPRAPAPSARSTARRPAIGQVGQVEEVAEDRLEIVLPRERRAAVLAALRAAHPYEQPAFTLVAQATEEAATGTGRIGDLPEPMTLRAFAQRVAAVLPATPQGIRVGGDLDAEVRTVAVCGGAGDSLLAQVRRLGADVYLTADLRHHPASEHLAGGRPYLVDATHWASEWPWLPARRGAAARGRGRARH